jgi:hypothetical protein
LSTFGKPVDETRPGTWGAPFYELYVEFNGHSAQRLYTAFDALWGHPALRGPYAQHDAPFSDQRTVTPASGVDPTGDVPVHLYGIACLATGESVPCGSVAHVQPGLDDDGLTFYITAGALAQIGRDIEEPSAADETWLASLDEWFAEIGRAVYAVAPFEVATIGHQILSLDSAEAIRHGRGGGLEWSLPAHLRIKDSQLVFTPHG